MHGQGHYKKVYQENNACVHSLKTEFATYTYCLACTYVILRRIERFQNIRNKIAALLLA